MSTSQVASAQALRLPPSLGAAGIEIDDEGDGPCDADTDATGDGDEDGEEEERGAALPPLAGDTQ